MTIRIHRDHELGKDEARRRVDDISEELCDTYGLRSSWGGDTLKLEGGGVNCRIVVTDDSLEVNLRLGLALSMMKSVIRTSIENAMDEHLL